MCSVRKNLLYERVEFSQNTGKRSLLSMTLLIISKYFCYLTMRTFVNMLWGPTAIWLQLTFFDSCESGENTPFNLVFRLPDDQESCLKKTNLKSDFTIIFSAFSKNEPIFVFGSLKNNNTQKIGSFLEKGRENCCEVGFE